MVISTINNSPCALQQAPEIILSEESTDLLQRLKKINAGYFFNPDHVLVNKLKVIEPVELKAVLNHYFMEVVQKEHITDPVKFLDRLAAVIPLEKMQEVVKDEFVDSLAEAKGMLEEAKLYLQMTHENNSPSIRARLSSLLDGIISLIETILTAFGIADFFKPAESDNHADSKFSKIMMLFSYFSMFSALFLPLVGATVAGLVIGGSFLAIAALSGIWPYIKPKTTHLPANAENLTKQVQEGGFVAEGRKESLDEIANIIKMNRHAILVGPSRVGKSLTARALAQAIERGDYPELKGKVIFRINTTDLIGQKATFQGGGNKILNKISEEMGRHRDGIILVLDEIHMACKNKKEKIADQLKSFLDEAGEFPHVIAITTTEEFNSHVKDNLAFSLRFDRVDIKNTSQDETLKILGETLLRNSSKPLIKEDALVHIYDKSCEVENAPQPASAIKLLKQCINRTSKTQKSPMEKKIINISSKILSLRSQSAASLGRKKDIKEQITTLEKQLNELQETLRKEQKEIDHLFESKDLLDRVKMESYSSIIKISTIGQKTINSKTEKELKLFLLLQEFLGRSLETHIEKTAKTLGINAFIDNGLIDEVASA